jgi:hypothetical protein
VGEEEVAELKRSTLWRTRKMETAVTRTANHGRNTAFFEGLLLDDSRKENRLSACIVCFIANKAAKDACFPQYA